MTSVEAFVIFHFIAESNSLSKRPRSKGGATILKVGVIFLPSPILSGKLGGVNLFGPPLLPNWGGGSKYVEIKEGRD